MNMNKAAQICVKRKQRLDGGKEMQILQHKPSIEQMFGTHSSLRSIFTLNTHAVRHGDDIVGIEKTIHTMIETFGLGAIQRRARLSDALLKAFVGHLRQQLGHGGDGKLLLHRVHQLRLLVR